MGKLSLARKRGESIEIGDDVVLTVTRIHGNQVHLAFQAPNHIVIDRKEIAERKRMRR